MKRRKSWREKLEEDHPSHGRVVDVPLKWQKTYGTGKMLIARPLEVDALIREVRNGNLVTVTQIRERLAKDYCAKGMHADTTCPLTTGIFVRICAEVAEQDLIEGKKKVTPYWRVVKSDGSLNEKFPGGVKVQATRLRKEGHRIEPAKGRRPPRVKDFEKSLKRL